MRESISDSVLREWAKDLVDHEIVEMRLNAMIRGERERRESDFITNPLYNRERNDLARAEWLGRWISLEDARERR